jgi:two-component system KDP operon response regulator KdpE
MPRGSPEGGAGATFRTGDLEVDLAARVVRLDGAEVHLTPTEFKLLALLVRHAGKVVTQRQLLTEVWGPGAAGSPHYLRVQMHGLRHKLEREPARPRYLVTEPGVGYRLKE